MKHINVLIPALALTILAACNLTRDVEVDLPEYENQPVVECYLEPGKPFRLLLSNSSAFFDPFNLDTNFINRTLLQGARVSIAFNGDTVDLPNFISVEQPIKFYNYTAFENVPYLPGTEFSLLITLPNGKTITGTTTMMPYVPIDTVKVEWPLNGDSLARIITYIIDDTSQANFYRRLLNYRSLDSVPEQNFTVSDRISENKTIAFGTAYELEKGDTVFNTIFHIDKPYYDYLESIQNAIGGSINPFAQPSGIKSNVGGTANGFGIFTSLIYDRDTTIVGQ